MYKIIPLQDLVACPQLHCQLTILHEEDSEVEKHLERVTDLMVVSQYVHSVAVSLVFVMLIGKFVDLAPAILQELFEEHCQVQPTDRI